GVILLIDGLLEQSSGVTHAELIGPRDQRAIARYLVMLDRLSVGDHAGVEDHSLLGLLHVLLTLFEDALDGGAGLGRGLEAAEAENLLKTLDLAFCFLEMMLEGLAELIRVRLLGHLRQCFKYLLLGIIHVLEQIDEKILQRLRGGHRCLLTLAVSFG